MVTRRQFFQRLLAAAGVAVAAPALISKAAATVWQVQTMDAMLFCSPQVKTAYEDLVRSDEAFWRAQR